MKRGGVPFPRPFCGAMQAEIRFDNNGKRIYAKRVVVEDIDIEVMIDTGGLYLMIQPKIADALRDQFDEQEHVREPMRISVRKVSVEGEIVRLPVTFLAEAGESLVIPDLAVFLPTEGSEWPDGTPNILGLEGALARMFFAFERLMMPDGKFYFGFEEE